MRLKGNFDKLIEKAGRIAVTSHLRADPDAVNSSLAMYHYLKNHKDKNVDVVLEGHPKQGKNEILHYSDIVWTEDLSQSIEKYDTVIFLDGTETTRFSGKDIIPVLRDKTTICLDHHPNETNYEYNLYYCDIDRAGTAHLLGEDIFDEKILLSDDDLAKFVMWGILGDTGTFLFVARKWSNVLPFTKKILDTYDFSIEQLNLAVSTKEPVDLNITQHLLQNVRYADLKSGHKIMYTYADEDFQENLGVSYDQFKSGVGTYMFAFLRKVRGYKFGFTLNKSPKGYSISFRSTKDGINVREIAIKLNGGGHIQAAGGQLSSSFAPTAREASDKIIDMFNSGELPLIDLVS